MVLGNAAHITMQLGVLTPCVADVDTAHGKSRGRRRAQKARAQRSRTALRSAGSRRHLLVLLRFPGYSDVGSFARVMGLLGWDDGLAELAPVGINQSVGCSPGTSSLIFCAHGDGAAMSVRTGGSPEWKDVPWGRWCPGWLKPCSAWLRVWACRATRSLATASAARRSWSSATSGTSTCCQSGWSRSSSRARTSVRAAVRPDGTGGTLW